MSKSDLISKEVANVTKQAAIICPVSGLVIQSNLPPLPSGLYLNLTHPMVDIISGLLKGSDKSINWAYLTSLPVDLKAGALISALSSLNKVLYLNGSNAYATRLSMMANLSSEQLDKALYFVKTRIYQGKTSFAPLPVLESYVDSKVWDAFVAAIYKLDYYAANAEANGWLDDEEETVKMLDSWDSSAQEFMLTKPSHKSEAKRLNSNCLDAYKEFEEYLPKATRLKAKTLVKELATFPDQAVIDSFIKGIAKYAMDDVIEDEMSNAPVTYNEFRDTVTLCRSVARDLELILDFSTIGKVVSVPTPGAISEPVIEAQAEPVVKKLTLRERIALKNSEA